MLGARDRQGGASTIAALNAMTRPSRRTPRTALSLVTAWTTVSAAYEVTVHSGTGRDVPAMSHSSAPTMIPAV